jgi:hypothetical protein
MLLFCDTLPLKQEITVNRGPVKLVARFMVMFREVGRQLSILYTVYCTQDMTQRFFYSQKKAWGGEGRGFWLKLYQ